MLVFVKDAEETLLRDLKKHRDLFPTHRCLYLKFSQLNEEKEEWFSALIEIIRDRGQDDLNQIYVCHDNDVFILSRGMTHKSLEQFLAHLAPKLTPAPLPELAVLFEIGVDWARLGLICERKIEAKIEALKALQAQESSDEEMLARKEALLKLNREMAASLPDRREKRKEPEILIVEDDPFTQRLVGNALKDKYPFSVTGSGQNAISEYLSKAPDILFLDIGLPDMSGHSVLQRIFQIDPQAYVVMFSGNGDRENVLRAIDQGAKGFVGKPFTQEKLFQYIEKSPFIQTKLKKETLHGYSQS
ncbi:MAG: response regulator [Alphaproteobacteria bacterium]|nr:response regulator [Alphaproteobacteria bacterium]